MRTLVLGMGNPILCDDAVGIRLARDFRAYLEEQAGPACLGEQASVPRTHGQGGPLPVGECQVDFVEECSVGGLNLVDLVAGYDRLIVFDSIRTPRAAPGTWYALTGATFRETMNLTNIHDVNFTTALELGRRLGAHIPRPEDVHIFAVEIADNTTFLETMTAELEEAYPRISRAIMQAAYAILAQR